MEQNKNASPKKISANLFDQSVLAEFENAANARNKNDKIRMDDLSTDVRNKINSWGAPAGSSYNDEELRNRILAVENSFISKDKAFDKTIDKIGTGLLDSTLTTTIDNISSIDTRVSTLETGKADDSVVRKKSVKIEREDIAKDIIDKIDASYGYYQSVIPSGGMSTITDIGAIATAVNDLKEEKLGKLEAEQNYRKKDVKITLGDLDTQLSQAANNAIEMNTKLNEKADKNTLANYRKTSDKIVQDDLSPEVANIVQRTGEMIADVDDAIATAIEGKLDNVRKELSAEDIGYKYNYLDKNVVVGTGGQVTGDNVGMPYRRQIVKLAGKDETSHPQHDTYTIYDTLNWVIRAVTGTQYDKAMIDEKTQKEICTFAASKGGDYTAHRSFGANKPYFGVVENGFTLVETIAYLLDKIDKLEKRIKKLEP